MFHEVEKVQHTTLTLNLLLLLVVAFIPYPTGVIGKYGALRSAVVLYGTTFTAAGLAFSALWFDIRRNRLSREAQHDARIRSITVRNLSGPMIYPLATGLAFLAPKTSLGIFLDLLVSTSFPVCNRAGMTNREPFTEDRYKDGATAPVFSGSGKERTR
jgi:uncharacterized membrane protein